jgi:uncharacterized membrane protein YfcA
MIDWGIAAAALGIGALIGCVGIGGVLLVPTLAFLGGIAIHDAIAAAMFSYLFSGAAATWIYARKGSIDWGSSLWLAIGAMPAALAGAVAASHVGARVLELLIAALVIFAGLRALRPGASVERTTTLDKGGLVGLGAFVGFGSALTGTGGPLLLVPLLVWMKMPILTTIGLSQVIQLPIAALASAGNVYFDLLDLRLGALLAVTLLVGSVIGARAAHVLPGQTLTRFVGLLMLAVGAFIILRTTGLLGA